MKKKLNKKQKLFHLIGVPVLTFIALYLIGFIMKAEPPEYWEALGPAFGLSVVYWFEMFYPSKPEKDPEEAETSLKEDIKKYTVNGSSFNRLMVIIYSLIIFLAIAAYVWAV